MVRLKMVDWKNKTEESKEYLQLCNSKNYLKIILENYYLYNSYARLDIAQILLEKLQEIQKNQPSYLAIQKNIFLEIYSKYIQTIEDLALVGRVLLYTDKSHSSAEIYMESNNGDILSFYKNAFNGFSDKEISKIMGVNKIKEYILSNNQLNKDEKENFKKIIKESMDTEKENLKMLSKVYLEKNIDDKGKEHLNLGGTIDLYNSVKHGFRLVQPTKASKNIWKQLNSQSVDVMHQLILDESSNQKIIVTGGFESINQDVIKSIMFNLEHFSKTLNFICEIRLWSEKDPMFVIRKLRLIKSNDEIKKRKIKPNDLCPCGSKLKFKKCCLYYKHIIDNTDPYSLVDL